MRHSRNRRFVRAHATARAKLAMSSSYFFFKSVCLHILSFYTTLSVFAAHLPVPSDTLNVYSNVYSNVTMPNGTRYTSSTVSIQTQLLFWGRTAKAVNALLRTPTKHPLVKYVVRIPEGTLSTPERVLRLLIALESAFGPKTTKMTKR